MSNFYICDSFHKYLVFYPYKYQTGYDGIHYGGIKGIKKSAPQEAKKDFWDYIESIKKDKVCGWKMIDYKEIDDE